MTFRLRARWRLFRIRYGWTPILCGMILAVFAVLAHQRNELWRDPVALWKDVTLKSPDKPRAWFGLATVYMQQFARTHDAIDGQLAMATLIRADVLAQKRGDEVVMVPVETNMAILMMHNGDYAGAASILTRIVKKYQGYDEAWAAFATLHAKAGDPQEALNITGQLLDEAMWRSRASLFVTRAEAFCRLGRVGSANDNYAVARKLDSSLREARCE